MATMSLSLVTNSTSRRLIKKRRAAPSQPPCAIRVQAEESLPPLQHRNADRLPHLSIARRELLAAAVLASCPASMLVSPFPSAASPESEEVDAQFVRFTGASGYSLLRPAAWEQVDKAGADALFRDPQHKSSTLGVTILPVMIAALDQFGSLEAVGEKLLAAERAKESTLSVAMLSQAQRAAPFGTCYDFVYELSSTRGNKRIVNSVAIVNKKLYIVNGTTGCGKEACGDAAAADVVVLEKATQSLEIA